MCVILLKYEFGPCFIFFRKFSTDVYVKRFFLLSSTVPDFPAVNSLTTISNFYLFDK